MPLRRRRTRHRPDRALGLRPARLRRGARARPRPRQGGGPGARERSPLRARRAPQPDPQRARRPGDVRLDRPRLRHGPPPRGGAPARHVGAANCDIYQATEEGLRCVVSHDRSGFDEEAVGQAARCLPVPELGRGGGERTAVRRVEPGRPAAVGTGTRGLPRVRLQQRGLRAVDRQRRALRPDRHLRHAAAELLASTSASSAASA